MDDAGRLMLRDMSDPSAGSISQSSPPTDRTETVLPTRYLVVASETPDQRLERRNDTGASSDETFSRTLLGLAPGSEVDSISCVDGLPAPSIAILQTYDAVFFSGSPISMHERTPQTIEAADFMRRVFVSGVPSFGSCAGLQIAAVAAGGTTKKREPRTEAAFARGIVATEAGHDHPLLRGRPAVWDAPAMHSDEVDRLPESGTVLARTNKTAVQAVEIRHASGVFWGVQYHPELTLAEIASALRRQADDLVEQGLAEDAAAVHEHASRIEALGERPDRRDLAWQLGLDEEVTASDRRMAEIVNFIGCATSLRNCPDIAFDAEAA
jgi:GMP synthase (glutamine-hydrolysing)